MKHSLCILVLMAGTVISCSVQEMKVSAKNGLILREEPSVSSKFILNIPDKAIVRIVSTQGPEDFIDKNMANWYKVEYNKTAGWVFSLYLIDKDTNADATDYSKIIKSHPDYAKTKYAKVINDLIYDGVDILKKKPSDIIARYGNPRKIIYGKDIVNIQAVKAKINTYVYNNNICAILVPFSSFFGEPIQSEGDLCLVIVRDNLMNVKRSIRVGNHYNDLLNNLGNPQRIKDNTLVYSAILTGHVYEYNSISFKIENNKIKEIQWSLWPD